MKYFYNILILLLILIFTVFAISGFHYMVGDKFIRGRIFRAIWVSPVDSKPATGGRIKTSQCLPPMIASPCCFCKHDLFVQTRRLPDGQAGSSCL